MKIGDKVKFKHDIWEIGSQYHPTFLLAKKGDIAVVESFHPEKWMYTIGVVIVNLDIHFRVSENDIEKYNE